MSTRYREPKIAVLGNFPPRRCGIATFTADLVGALAAKNQGSVFAVAMNDTAEGYSYPEEVRFELAQADYADYLRTADFLNLQNVDVVNVQHEFGIFGGPAGEHLLALLRELKAPVVTTLHTVLEHPSSDQRRVMDGLIRYSERLVVMSALGEKFLRTVYGVPESQIELIPHGIPDVPFSDPDFYKDTFGVEGKTVLLTFGLLSPNKGLEHALRALPEIVSAHPDVVYIILGATHPHLLRTEGESYRLSLQRLARSLGVEEHVVFYDQFVELSDLVTFISAADLYLTPYTNREQITSGTLAYALGAGKAIVSTPYWYAEELLADGCGVLTPFADPDALAKNVLEVLGNAPARDALRKRAYLRGREMIWSAVATRYYSAFERATHAGAARAALPEPLAARPTEFPPLDLRHLYALTDATGMLQHALYSVPNYHEGYTTDDNARALLAGVLLEAHGNTEAGELTSKYLAFLNYAFDPETRSFRNVLTYERRWLGPASEDAHGRALWALGTVLGRSQDENLRGLAGYLFEAALPGAQDLTSPRAWAFTLLGLRDYLGRFCGDRAAQRLQGTLADKLLELYRTHSAPDWPWFEPVLSYCNAKLPHALIATGTSLGRAELTELGLSALDWLTRVQTNGEHLSFVGNSGFYPQGGPKATFDQQPVEAHAQVSACLEAYRASGNARYLTEANRAFEWFLGENDLGLPLYDPRTGGCCDGLHPDRVNRNQGAESSLAFLLSLLELRLAAAQRPLAVRQLEPAAAAD